MSQSTDLRHMARALRLAERGLYSTQPNPRVGCVLAHGPELVGEGYHRRTGGAHAEPIALTDAGERARGATAYVTLEPCCHHGRTPPCSEALIQAGVARVVVAMRDPNPQVAGKGLDQLARAGIQVECGLLEEQARVLNAGFIKRMTQGLPQVCCKLAMSLDGRTAMASGESQWITGAAARQDAHLLRARSGAILTGIGTVLVDDPALNVRLAPEDIPGLAPSDVLHQPLRVVLDSRLRMPAQARMLELPGRTLVLCLAQDSAQTAVLEARGAQVWRMPGTVARQVDLEAALRMLADQECNDVLIEAGPTLAGSALNAGLVDELVIYMAPHLMGDGARGLCHLPTLRHMGERIALEILDLRAVGADWRITARPV